MSDSRDRCLPDGPADGSSTSTATATAARPFPGTAALLPGTTLGDRFRLHEVLGRGNYGTVYRATDELLEREVAVKLLRTEMLDDRARERLRREVRASATGHPALVQVYELYEVDGHIFLALELVDGASLGSRLRKEPRLEPDEVVAVARNLAAGLEHLHRQGLVHRDVKPSNILITHQGEAKLCDLGLVRDIEPGETVTESAVLVGTPSYMAPEQAMGMKVTGAADVYALGLTLYRCLAGEVPLVAESAVATLVRRQREQAPQLQRLRPDCPRWLADLVHWMLEPRPGDRPGAADVRRALEQRRVGLHLPFRKRRAIVGVVAAATLTASLGLVTRQERTVDVDADATTVYGRTAGGRRTWIHELAHPIAQRERVDLDGDGRPELVVVTHAHSTAPVERASSVPSAEILMIRSSGEVVERAALNDLIQIEWQGFQPRFNPALHPTDLDGDGWTEVVVSYYHSLFYPSGLLVYWPRYRTWDEVLWHPGRLFAVTPLPSADHPRLVFLAVNNRTGYLPVVGRIALRPPRGRPVSVVRDDVVLSAPSETPWRETALASLETYVPVASLGWHRGLGPRQLAVTPEGTTRFWFDGLEGALDNLGNPVPGPNRGLDLTALRLRFWTLIQRLDEAARVSTPAEVQGALLEIESGFSPLLREDAYRVVSALFGARALAGAGDPTAAVELATSVATDVVNDDLELLLANLQAIEGRVNEATARVRRVMEARRTSRAGHDSARLLLDLAIGTRSRALLNESVARLSQQPRSAAQREDLAASLRARAHVMWNSVVDGDLEVRTWSFEPGGEAWACLARWRSGRVEPGDPERMAALADGNEEARDAALLARAAALGALGHRNEALSVLQTILPRLEQGARLDYSAVLNLVLAQEIQTVVRLGAVDPS